MKTDLLVLGTGVTGKNTLRYLQSHPDRASFTFSIAGRSQSKLQLLIDELGLSKDIPLILVDVQDASQVEAAVKTTKVVINTVGPYWLYGTAVVGACVRNGVHHVDLTGETHWVKDIIQQYDYYATKTGSIIVPACGLDSIPSDILAYLGHKTLSIVDQNAHISVGKSATAFKFKGRISGGTASTIMAMIEAPRATIRWATSSHSLSPVVGIPHDPSKLTFSLPIPFTTRTLVGGTFPMTFINRPIVQRSWGLFEYQNIVSPSRETDRIRYGADFQYEEFIVMPSRIQAFVFSVGYMLTMLTLLITPIRNIVKNIIPQSGDGPQTEEELHKGFLDVTNVTSSSSGTVHAISTFKGLGDPGYYLSCIMLAECALALLNPEKLSPFAQKGGVLTTATAFGDELVDRLNKTGKIQIESKLAKARDQGVDGKPVHY